jgi:hypothetical protein
MMTQVAAENNVGEKFAKHHDVAKPVWAELLVITELSLAARMLTEEEIFKFKEACTSYQQGVYASDDSDALKRHMYLHLVQLAEEFKTIGLFSETAR